MRKVTRGFVPEYRAFIERSRFCLLSSVGPEGTDCSPRGDDGPVVRVLDEVYLALPDWTGNNRIDSLRNIVRDGRVSLTFMVRGSDNVARINGRAKPTVDAGLRAAIWNGADDSAGLPTPGQILAAPTEGAVGGPDHDRAWPERAAKSLW